MAESTDQKSRSGIQVIARAAAVLRALKVDPTGQSLGQIAETVGLPRSTVQRIIGALLSERLVVSDARNGGIRLGPEVAALAAAVRQNVVDLCRKPLQDLARDTGETADLSALRGTAMVFLDQIAGNHRLRTVSSVGEVFPLTTTANGTACLSLLSEDAATALIHHEWAERGLNRSIDDFRNTLEQIRRNRLAYDLGDHTQGISAIGFAFADPSGALHAISVPVPATRFDEVRERVEAALLRAADQVDELMIA